MSFAFSVGYKFNLLARCLTRTETRTPAPLPPLAPPWPRSANAQTCRHLSFSCRSFSTPRASFTSTFLSQFINCPTVYVAQSVVLSRQTDRGGGRGASLDICMPHRTINENFRICQSIITSTDSTDPGMGSTGLRFCCAVNYVACCGCYFISSSLGPSSAGCSPSRCRNQIAARRGKPRRVELAAPRRCSPLGGMNLSYE